MKKFFSTIILISLCAMGSAQIQLSTRQYVISDFKQKTLNIILTGNDMYDAVIRSEIPAVWSISAYEFCSASDFEKRKKSPEWYFLALTDSKFNKESCAGIKSLCIFKGSPDAKEGFDGLYKVVSIPYCPVEDIGIDCSSYLCPLLDILQKEVVKMMDRKINLSSGVTVKSCNSLKKTNKKVIIDECFLQSEPSPATIATYARLGLKINPLNDSADKISIHNPEYVVGYSISPAEPVKGSVCFTMLIDASARELCYFKKTKIKEGAKGGFTEKELKRFASQISK